MTPRWKLARSSAPRYTLVAQLWAADIYRIQQPSGHFYTWVLLLSDNGLDQFGFDDHQVDQLFALLEDRWRGHLPDGFEDQVQALVALYQH